MKRRAAQPPRGPYTTPLRQLRRRLTFVFTVLTGTAVSYTHLTLPTKLEV